MSLISGSYSRLLWTRGAALLREAMLEKAAGVDVRAAKGYDCGVRRAIGLIALLRTLER